MTIDLQRAHALIDLLNNPYACVSDDVRELVSIATALLAARERSQRVAAPQANPVNVEGPEHLAPRPAPGLAFDARGVLVSVEQAEPVVAAPEMSRVSRAMLLNVLWHHQGGSSDVGQPLRRMLGIGRFDHLSDEQLSESKWIDALLSKAAREPR